MRVGPPGGANKPDGPLPTAGIRDRGRPDLTNSDPLGFYCRLNSEAADRRIRCSSPSQPRPRLVLDRDRGQPDSTANLLRGFIKAE